MENKRRGAYGVREGLSDLLKEQGLKRSVLRNRETNVKWT